MAAKKVKCRRLNQLAEHGADAHLSFSIRCSWRELKYKTSQQYLASHAVLHRFYDPGVQDHHQPFAQPGPGRAAAWMTLTCACDLVPLVGALDLKDSSNPA